MNDTTNLFNLLLFSFFLLFFPSWCLLKICWTPLVHTAHATAEVIRLIELLHYPMSMGNHLWCACVVCGVCVRAYNYVCAVDEFFSFCPCGIRERWYFSCNDNSWAKSTYTKSIHNFTQSPSQTIWEQHWTTIPCLLIIIMSTITDMTL